MSTSATPKSDAHHSTKSQLNFLKQSSQVCLCCCGCDFFLGLIFCFFLLSCNFYNIGIGFIGFATAYYALQTENDSTKFKYVFYGYSFLTILCVAMFILNLVVILSPEYITECLKVAAESGYPGASGEQLCSVSQTLDIIIVAFYIIAALITARNAKIAYNEYSFEKHVEESSTPQHSEMKDMA